mmetsp:Transcript_19013/g.53232  ORF Transcript_19013/g.53232 Transcript_19013/m.53232 type:complete len:87 (-) Transcript_19013:8-268(-)
MAISSLQRDWNFCPDISPPGICLSEAFFSAGTVHVCVHFVQQKSFDLAVPFIQLSVLEPVQRHLELKLKPIPLSIFCFSNSFKAAS